MTDSYEFRQEVLAKGRLIGVTEPCAETKGMWWQVYAHEGQIVALGMSHLGCAAIIGAVAGYLSLWSIYWCFKLLTGKEGMGYGDFKLLSAIGAWLGWSMLPLVILFSSLVGAIAGIGLLLAAKLNKNIPIPFGPYLVGGALISLFWGEKLNHAYFGLF